MQHPSSWSRHQLLPDVALDVFACGGEVPGPRVLLTAGIHGDEPEGVAALSLVARSLAALPAKQISGSVVVVPVVNVPAFDTGTRLTPLDGLNLARCFPGDEHGPPTRRLAHAFWRDFAADAEFVIDLHSGGVVSKFLPLAGFYGAPLPTNPAFLAARDFGMDIVWQLPDTSGVLSCEAARKGAVAVGCEFMGGGSLNPNGPTRYHRGIMRCLQSWSVLSNEVVEPTARTEEVWSGDWQLADTGGLFHASVELGQHVVTGQDLGAVVNVRGEEIQRFYAQHAGRILALRCLASVQSGGWCVLVGERIKVASG